MKKNTTEAFNKDLPYGDKPFIYAGNLTLDELLEFLREQSKGLSSLRYGVSNVITLEEDCQNTRKSIKAKYSHLVQSQSIIGSQWGSSLDLEAQSDSDTRVDE